MKRTALVTRMKRSGARPEARLTRTEREALREALPERKAEADELAEYWGVSPRYMCPALEFKYPCEAKDCCGGTQCARYSALGWCGVPGVRKPKDERPKCGAKTRKGTPCQAPIVPGKKRCRMHGGLSTGPKSQEGWARTREGYRRYCEQLRAGARA